jgi:hypothetical protein
VTQDRASGCVCASLSLIGQPTDGWAGTVGAFWSWMPAAVAVVFTWVFQRTDGSALLAVLLHAGLNLSTMSASVAGASARVTALVLMLKWLVAAAIIAA